MKISNENPTNHIFVGLAKYSSYAEIHKEYNNSFGYIEFDNYLIDGINLFLDNRKIPGIIIYSPNAYLIDEAFIYEEEEKDENSNYEGIKFDSLNFLKSKPTFNGPEMVKSSGYVIVFNHGFYLQFEEAIPIGMPSSIYRSSLFSYWRINHLLKRSKPI